VVVLGSVGCRERAPAPAAGYGALAAALAAPTCEVPLRPVTAAPAEGLWAYGEESTGQIVAMIGPSRVAAGETRVTRRVETIESLPDGQSIRFATDTAVVHLELLPAPLDSLGRVIAGAYSASGPAAVYAVSQRVVLASYEPCPSSGVSPRLRYLRRDTHGNPVIDVMLRQTSGGN
jgi:hypothetical protein